MDEQSDRTSRRRLRRIQPRRIRPLGQRRGAFLLPSLLTTGNMFCGFVAIICIFNCFSHPELRIMYFKYASILILGSILLDALDGRVARLTNTSSPFGLEYDSLADLVSFGVAPGLLAYAYALTPLGRIGWSAAFLYLICGALRLARYNITTTKLTKNIPWDYPFRLHRPSSHRWC